LLKLLLTWLKLLKLPLKLLKLPSKLLNSLLIQLLVKPLLLISMLLLGC
jgi:hypothetical protein